MKAKYKIVKACQPLFILVCRTVEWEKGDEGKPLYNLKNDQINALCGLMPAPYQMRPELNLVLEVQSFIVAFSSMNGPNVVSVLGKVYVRTAWPVSCAAVRYWQSVPCVNVMFGRKIQLLLVQFNWNSFPQKQYEQHLLKYTFAIIKLTVGIFINTTVHQGLVSIWLWLAYLVKVLQHRHGVTAWGS